MQNRNDAGCTEEFNTFIQITNDWAVFPTQKIFAENACAFLQVEVQVGSFMFGPQYAGRKNFQFSYKYIYAYIC